MKYYLVKFYYGTDCRATSRQEAVNEFAALALAMAEIKCAEWANHPGFSIEIHAD